MIKETLLPADRQPLWLRAESHQTRDLTSRVMSVRAASVDEKTRSVEATMTTEGQVTVFDWMNYETIDEVLVADGGQFPDQLPLLDNHNRYSLDNVLGAVREIRRDGTSWVGRAYFAQGDEEADKAWNKTKQRVLTDVSIGYRAIVFTDIPAGQTATVAGKSYTAGTRTCASPSSGKAKNFLLFRSAPIGTAK
jgi:hypothetical protein